MAILKQIKFPGMQEAAQIAVTQLTKKADAENAINALTLTSDNTGVDANGHPVYTIGLAVDGKTIVKDENDALKSGLQLVYHEAGKEGDAQQAAHIALTDNAGKELSVIPVSNIVGNGILKSSAYDAATGILTLTFAQADGTEKAVKVDLKAMLDINDMSIAENSKNYLEVTLGTAGVEGETQAVFGAKTVKVVEASDSKTGLVDAKDVKDYVDSKATDLAITAEGDAYVGASVNAETDKKHVIVASNVKDLTADAGAPGEYSEEGAQTKAPVAANLTGVAQSLVDGADVAAKVKTYVDGAIAIEVARADAKVLAAVKALDATVGSTTVENGKHVAVEVVETDGKLTGLTVTESDIASKVALDSEIAARKAVDGQNGQTYAANAGTHYIEQATSLNDADVKLDAALNAEVKRATDAEKAIESKVDQIKYNVDGTTLIVVGIPQDETLKADKA